LNTLGQLSFLGRASGNAIRKREISPRRDLP
jgi:hypothetical protein